jgi:succinyl-diaminopimelate desuccinylase
MAPRLAKSAGAVFIITAGEERGCEGANFLVREDVLPAIGALVVAEPTSNRLLAGHKGVFWLEATARGVTAHGSTPEQGVNAVYKAARAVTALSALDLSDLRHEILGPPTLNVGWLRGGINVNSVPDEARFGLDVRLVPGVDRDTLLSRLRKAAGGAIEFEMKGTSDPVWTDPGDPWIREVAAIAGSVTGQDLAIGGATYFTDAGALKPGMGNPPTVILGPGDPALAHQTDEYCLVSRIEEAEAIYGELLARWCDI